MTFSEGLPGKGDFRWVAPGLGGGRIQLPLDVSKPRTEMHRGPAAVQIDAPLRPAAQIPDQGLDVPEQGLIEYPPRATYAPVLPPAMDFSVRDGESYVVLVSSRLRKIGVVSGTDIGVTTTLINPDYGLPDIRSHVIYAGREYGDSAAAVS